MSDQPRSPRDRTLVSGTPPSVLVRLMPLASDPPTPAGEAGTPDLPPDAPRRYRLRRALGKGGVGVVYLGHDVELGRDVAVKFLQAEHAGRADLESRFLEEAQIGGQLEHPGIVPVYDVGIAGKQPFFAMKLIRGHALHLRLLARTSPADDLPGLLTIFEQVCHAVGYAHARGVVHRDLKPGNVMIGAFGEVQVVDWGMGKVMPGPAVAPASAAATPAGEAAPPPKVRTLRSAESTPSADSVGAVLGTPAYMPPEQARGDSERTGPWSDVFALGAILCEILTGRPAYTGRARKDETFADAILREAMAAELEDAYGRLDACGADVELVALCRECLSPSPAARPATAQDIARRIEDHRAGVEARAHHARVRALVARTRIRQLGVFVAVLVLALAATVYFMREAQLQEGFAHTAADEARRQTERADREAADARRSADVATRERAAAVQAEQTAKRAEALAQARAEDALAARNEAETQRTAALAAAASERAAQALEKEAYRKEAAALRAAQEERSKAATRARRAAYAARIAAADSALLRGDMAGCAQLLADCETDLRGFEWRHLQLRIERSLGTAWIGAPLTAVATAPGLRVVASSDGRLRVFRGGTLESRGQITAHTGGVFALAIAPDGRTVASGGADGALRLWDPITLRLAATLRAGGERITNVAFDAQGTRLACGGFDEVVQVFDLATQALVATLPGNVGGTGSLAFARDHLLVGTATGLLREYDPALRMVTEIAVHDDAILAIASHDASGTIALGTLDGRIVLRSRTDQSATRTLRVADAGTTSLAFTSDGALLASGHTDHVVRTWDVGGGILIAAAPGHRDAVTGVAFAADRDGTTRILSVSPDGSLRVWAARTGAAAYVFEEPRPVTNHLALAVRDMGIVTFGAHGVRALTWANDTLDVQSALFVETPDWHERFGGEPWREGAAWLGDLDTAPAAALMVAADGRRIGALSGDGHAVWEWRAGLADLRRFTLPQAATCIGLAGDDLIAGTASGDVLALTATGVRVLRSGAARVRVVAGSAQGKYAILAEGQPLEILDVGEGRSAYGALRGTMGLSTAALDPPGTRVAVGSDDGTIRIVDTESGAELIELRCRSSAVRALAWRADGRRMVALYADGALACFDDSLASARTLWAVDAATRSRRGPQAVAIRAWP